MNVPEEPAPSGGSARNQNRDTNKKKLTFVGGGAKVSARIRQLQEENNIVCVMGSGRCGTHNVKLMKSVKSKKISCVEPGGGVGWKYVDVTCLVCPSKAKSSAGFGMATDLTGGGARKKRKVMRLLRVRQLTLSTNQKTVLSPGMIHRGDDWWTG